MFKWLYQLFCIHTYITEVNNKKLSKVCVLCGKVKYARN